MSRAVSFPVPYRLKPVREADYPEWKDQVWAEPNLNSAVAFLLRIINDPTHAEAVGARARRHMKENFSDRVLGARYRDRLALLR